MEHLQVHLPLSCLLLEGWRTQTDARRGGEVSMFVPQEDGWVRLEAETVVL